MPFSSTILPPTSFSTYRSSIFDILLQNSIQECNKDHIPGRCASAVPLLLPPWANGISLWIWSVRCRRSREVQPSNNRLNYHVSILIPTSAVSSFVMLRTIARAGRLATRMRAVQPALARSLVYLPARLQDGESNAVAASLSLFVSQTRHQQGYQQLVALITPPFIYQLISVAII